jgi:hypothetical protein
LKIKELKLRNFRNYEELSLQLNDGYNVIFGENGQGKTNIIESIFLCASGRSHRTSKDAELINLDAKAYKVFMAYERDRRDFSLEIDYEKGEKKRIRLNEIPLKKLGEMIGQFNAVIFSPEDLMLIKDHISLFSPSPLRGKNLKEFGVRFPGLKFLLIPPAAFVTNRLSMPRSLKILICSTICSTSKPS